MADALTVLRNNGILMPETMIRAAQLENVTLAVAATILMKESGGGRNVWGSDGVQTGGTYRKGGPVTRDNYLAYRTAMRAKQIGRQGVGPTQCTSAQYQDTADALGGCWDPLANMRSGFRGMGALIRAYGVQQGARRYNGSGPLAEKYGRDFLARYAPWERRLAGLPIPNVVVPSVSAPTVAPAPPKPKGIPDMIERRLTVGNNHGRVNCPAENKSKVASEVWVSVSCEGGGRGTVAFQVDSTTDGPPSGAGDPWNFAVRNGNRGKVRMPANTEFIEYWITQNGVRQQDGSVVGEGSLLVEFVPR